VNIFEISTSNNATYEKFATIQQETKNLNFGPVDPLKILRHAKGGEGLLTFMTKCDKGWVISFWIVMSYFLNSTFGLKIASLALFKKIGPTSKNNQANPS